MGEARYVMGQPAGQQILFFKTWLRVGFGRRRKPSFEKQKWLAGWLAHHISGFPHPFWVYIIGIGILLDIYIYISPIMGGISILWWYFPLLVFSILSQYFLYYGDIMQVQPAPVVGPG